MKRVTFTFFESFYNLGCDYQVLIIAIFSENCLWGPWSNWVSCSKTCGTGSETRSRTKTKTERNGGTCSGSGSDSQPCNTQPCPGK